MDNSALLHWLWGFAKQFTRPPPLASAKVNKCLFSGTRIIQIGGKDPFHNRQLQSLTYYDLGTF